MTDQLTDIISRLSPACRSAIALAANLCVVRQHEAIGLDHLWASMLDMAPGDAVMLMGQVGVDTLAVKRDVTASLARARPQSSGTPVFSTDLSAVLRRAALMAKPGGYIGSADLLLAMADADEWREGVTALSPTLAAVTPCVFVDALKTYDAIEVERSFIPTAESRPDGALARFTIDLTAKAREGQLDAVVGRERETLQLIDVLGRRRQNNPILVGEAGVGKTAVVEGLALAIAAGTVPGALASVRLLVLDLGLMQAGASVKGEFESRLRDLLAEVAESPQPIVLFIDEAHTMIGAGGTAGQNDAANLLKPSLARGEIRTIGATTWAEYKKYFEKDAALARRFHPIEVGEPDAATAASMLRAIVPALEKHAGVRILDEAVTAAVDLSARYVRDRQLPDKAISLLDTAAARVALSRMSPHPRLAVLEGELARARARYDAKVRDVNETGGPAQSCRADLNDIDAIERHIASERQRIADELAALGQPRTDASRADGIALVPRCVDARVVAEVVSDWTGVPAGRLAESELVALADLQTRLQQRVAGQEHAARAIAERVRSARAGLGDPGRPAGVFLLAGPSGVGKTETALALAAALTGDERQLVTVNMSEYQEAHAISGLKGAPAGYVGYGEGGALTETVRRHPYGVLLLDEVEKAHPDVRELFYQVFDRGYMTDAEGRDIDFRNLTILLTSNVGSASVMQACLNKRPSERPGPDALIDIMRPSLYQAFAPAFLGRMQVLPYFPLADETLEHIVRKRLTDVAARVATSHGARLTFGQPVIDWVIARCVEADAGARAALRLLDGPVLTTITNAVLGRPSASHVALNLGCLGDEVHCKWTSPKKAR